MEFFMTCKLYNIKGLFFRAYKVFVVSPPASSGIVGQVIGIEGNHFIVQCLKNHETAEVHREKLPKFCLPIKVGDSVEYELAEAPGNPSARIAKLTNLTERSYEEIKEFFKKTTQSLKTSLVDQILNELLPGKSYFRLVAYS
jgi:hypothetical protein